MNPMQWLSARGQSSRGRPVVAGVVVVMLLALATSSVFAAGEALTRMAQLSGGGQATSGPVVLRAAVGQPVAGTVTSEGTYLCAGVFCTTGSPPIENGNVYTVTVADFAFAPDPIEIEVGDTVIWQRLSGAHNVQADDGSFSSGPVSATWTTYERTFTTPGTYGYHCTAHGSPGAGMFGTVIVRDGQSEVEEQVHLPLIWR